MLMLWTSLGEMTVVTHLLCIISVAIIRVTKLIFIFMITAVQIISPDRKSSMTSIEKTHVDNIVDSRIAFPLE